MKQVISTRIIGIVEFHIKFTREWLFRTAMGDGILSDEELNILFSTDINFTLLQDTVNKACEDQIIDEYEKHEIKKIINLISDNAISTEKINDCLTQELIDRYRLLKILQLQMIPVENLLLK